MGSRFKMALLQMFVEYHREQNLAKAARMIKEAANHGAKVVALPEYFTCWMDPKYFVANQEKTTGPTTEMLSRAAKENAMYIFGGSFPETIPGSDKLYNTCNIFNPNGDIIARYRKLHMFDVDLGPRLKITESELNEHGNSLTTVNTDFCKVGFGICLDLRFPEMSRLYADKGVHLLNFMGGFSLKTGPAHLETLMRARAIDNQVFLANVGPARNDAAPYVTYGHSGFVDPWGEVIAKTGSDEDIVYADIGSEYPLYLLYMNHKTGDLETWFTPLDNTSYVAEIRRKMPIEKLRRDDIYKVEELKPKPSV